MKTLNGLTDRQVERLSLRLLEKTKALIAAGRDHDRVHRIALRVIPAMVRRNMGVGAGAAPRSFRDLMVELDMALTGKDRRAAAGPSARRTASTTCRTAATRSLDRVKRAWAGPDARRIAAELRRALAAERGAAS